MHNFGYKIMVLSHLIPKSGAKRGAIKRVYKWR